VDWIRTRFTSAHAIALVALFVALGGTGYAALKLPKNSVSAKQIKRNAVMSGEIRNGSVRSVDIREGAVGEQQVAFESLKAAHMMNGSLKAEDFMAGELPAGPQGAKGDTGATGTFGSVTTQYELAAAPLADNAKESYDVHCPEGQTAIGGGARGDATDSELTNVTSSRPIISTTSPGAPVDGGTFTGWRATVFNPSGGPAADIRPEVWVTCATPAS
jgi:hypothetical protein